MKLGVDFNLYSISNIYKCIYQNQTFHLNSNTNAIKLVINNTHPQNNYPIDLTIFSEVDSNISYKRTFFVKTIKPLDLIIENYTNYTYPGGSITVNGSVYDENYSIVYCNYNNYQGGNASFSHNNDFKNFSITFDVSDAHVYQDSINLTVYAENKDKNEMIKYGFNISVGEPPKSNLDKGNEIDPKKRNLIIILVVVGVLAIVILTIVIIYMKKRKNEQNNSETIEGDEKNETKVNSIDDAPNKEI